MQSSLDWSLVKPPRLTNARSRGRYRVGPSLRVGLLSNLSRDDLAMFLLAALMSGKWMGEAVFLKSV